LEKAAADVDAVELREGVAELTTLFSSAAVVVMILKVEPGGAGARGRARHREHVAVLASRTTARPEYPDRVRGGLLMVGTIVVVTGSPALACAGRDASRRPGRHVAAV